jgi:hypothetical protein
MILHPEGEDIAPLLASETVEHLPVRTDREGRGLFSVKRAQTHEILPGLFELNILADNLYDVSRPFYLLFGRLGT